MWRGKGHRSQWSYNSTSQRMTIPICSYTTQKNSLLLKIIMPLFVTSRIIFAMTCGLVTCWRLFWLPRCCRPKWLPLQWPACQWPTSSHFSKPATQARNGCCCDDPQVSDVLAALSATSLLLPKKVTVAMTRRSATYQCTANSKSQPTPWNNFHPQNPTISTQI